MEDLKLIFLHDRFFKESMERISIAVDFIRLFLSSKLFFPINYDSLTIDKETWINSELRQHAGDVLYRGETENTKKPFFLLFEHKSVVDEDAVFQNFRNTVEIVEEERKNSHKKKIPSIWPVIVSHGNSPWTADNSISSIFEIIEGTKNRLVQQPDIVIDLYEFPDNAILGCAEFKAFVFSLKYSRSPKLLEMLPLILQCFNDGSDEALDYFSVVITYLYSAAPVKYRVEISMQVERFLKEGDQNMKKFSSIWEELGYIVGVDDQKKRDQLEIEKKDEVIEKTACNLFKKGLSVEEISVITGLSAQEIKKILKL